MKVTFIGLGIMGLRMAGNLLKNNVDLTVYNRTEGPALELETKGARRSGSPSDAVVGSDFIFTMLSEPEIVEKIMLTENGAIHHIKKGALWIDCSTVNPSFSLECKKHAETAGIRFMDAPVAGTKPSAENAELVFFVGGEEADFKETEALLKLMGNKIIHIGETGRGTAFKMLVNAMLAESMIIFSETVLLGEKMGFSPEILMKSLSEMPVSAPFLKAKATKLINKNDETQFPLELMHKDLRLFSTTAEENNHEPSLADHAKALYADAVQKGFGRKDFSAIYNYLKR